MNVMNLVNITEAEELFGDDFLMTESAELCEPIEQCCGGNKSSCEDINSSCEPFALDLEREHRLLERRQRCKRDRTRQKLELETLREQVTALTDQYSILKRLKDVEKSFCSPWEQRARIQAVQRQMASNENSKLRAAVAEQAALAESLQRLLTKKPRVSVRILLLMLNFTQVPSSNVQLY